MKKIKSKKAQGDETLYDIWTGKPVPVDQKLAIANKIVKALERNGTAPWLKK